jgi:hypothetical protein
MSLLVLTDNCVVLTTTEAECSNGQGSLGNSDETDLGWWERAHTVVLEIL